MPPPANSQSSYTIDIVYRDTFEGRVSSEATVNIVCCLCSVDNNIELHRPTRGCSIRVLIVTLCFHVVTVGNNVP